MDGVIGRQPEQVCGELREIGLMAHEHDAVLSAEGAQFLERALRVHAAGEPARDDQFRPQGRGDDLRGFVRPADRAAEHERKLHVVRFAKPRDLLGLALSLFGQGTGVVAWRGGVSVRMSQEVKEHGAGYITMPPSTVRTWPVMYF